jgi:hypothetical protein
MPIIKNLLDAAVEKPGKPEGEWQRRIVFAGFDGVDGLA